MKTLRKDCKYRSKFRWTLLWNPLFCTSLKPKWKSTQLNHENFNQGEKAYLKWMVHLVIFDLLNKRVCCMMYAMCMSVSAPNDANVFNYLLISNKLKCQHLILETFFVRFNVASIKWNQIKIWIRKKASFVNITNKTHRYPRYIYTATLFSGFITRLNNISFEKLSFDFVFFFLSLKSTPYQLVRIYLMSISNEHTCHTYKYRMILFSVWTVCLICM